MTVFKLIGDSKIIVDWFNGKMDLRILQLKLWKRKVWKLQQQFVDLQILHYYREHNVLANLLSKKAYFWILAFVPVQNSAIVFYHHYFPLIS